MKRIVIAAVAAGATMLTFAMSASALPIDPGGPGDEPGPGQTVPPPPMPSDLTISGRVSVTNCPNVTASDISVDLAGKSRWNSDEFYSVGVTGGPTSFTYSAANVMRGSYVLTPKLRSGACPYGVFSPTTRTTDYFNVANKTISSQNFSYAGPAHVTRIPTTLAVAALNDALSTAKLHLDNFGPAHGASNQLDNGSTASILGLSTTFTIPEYDIDLDCGLVCPDLGQGRFYVNEFNSTSVNASWTSRAFAVGVGFESVDHEVKGIYTYNDSRSDNLMPDVEINGARIGFSLAPVADGHGSITYRRQGDVTFTGSLQATGPCDVFGIDLCDFFGSYKSKITSAVKSGLAAVLDAPAAKAAAATQFRTLLNSLGIGQVVRVVNESDAIVVVW
jgi:hypothetical protein